MSQVEIIRPEALGIPKADIRKYEDSIADVVAEGGSEYVKQRLAVLSKPRRAPRPTARAVSMRRTPKSPSR